MTGLAPRPRVLFLTQPAGGGIASFATQLATRSRELVDVVELPYRRLYPALTTPGRNERRRCPAPPKGAVPYLPWTWIQPLRRIAHDRPAVVVCQWWHPLLAPYLLAVAVVARRIGARLAVVCHNAVPHERLPGDAQLTRALLTRADVVWTLSDHVAEEVARLAPAVRPVVLGHPPNLARGAAATSAGIAGAAPVGAARAGVPSLLFFGHVRPYKGLDDLLVALSLMSSEATLTVAGPFYTPVDAIRATAARLGVADRLRIVDGYVPDADVEGVFAAADVVVLPYRSASQSGVLALAAEFSRPVVATAVGSMAADIGDRGIVVPPADPAALAAALDRAIAAPPVPPLMPNDWDCWTAAVAAAAGAQPPRFVDKSRAAAMAS